MKIKPKLTFIFDFHDHVNTFEGNTAKEHGVDEDANSPNINFPVILFFLKDFRCHVVCCATESIDLLLFSLPGEAKITDFSDDSFFGFHLEDVFRFNVPVKDIMLVHVGETMDDFLSDGETLLKGEDALFFLGLYGGDVAKVAVLHDHKNPTIILIKNVLP